MIVYVIIDSSIIIILNITALTSVMTQNVLCSGLVCKRLLERCSFHSQKKVSVFDNQFLSFLQMFFF